MVILSNDGGSSNNLIYSFGEDQGQNLGTESYGQVITIPQDALISNFSFFTKKFLAAGTVTIKAFIYIFDRTTSKVGNKLYEGNAKILTTSTNFEKQTETINERVVVRQNDDIIFFFSTFDSNGIDLTPNMETATFMYQTGINSGVNNFFAFNNNNNWTTTGWREFNGELHYEIEIQPTILPNTTYTPPIICFPENTPVTTDQGDVPIQDLENKPYTIEGNKVLGTVSMTSNEPMVYFKQHSLAYNVPNKNTYITQSHVIYHNNTQLKAVDYTKKDFHKRLCMNNLKGIKQEKPILVKVENNKVYNVVLESEHKMKVNNMLVETLHPSNDLYKQKLLK